MLFTYSDAERTFSLRLFLKFSPEKAKFQRFFRVILLFGGKLSAGTWFDRRFRLFDFSGSGLFSAYRVPGFIRFCFERPHVGIDLHFEFSLEVTWCSPRVPACSASAIVEFAGGNDFAGLVYNVEGGGRLPLTVLLDSADVLFSGLSLDHKTNGNVAAAYLDVGFNQKGRAGFGAAVLEAGK